MAKLNIIVLRNWSSILPLKRTRGDSPSKRTHLITSRTLSYHLDTDILILDDKSISRKHAVLTVEPERETSDGPQQNQLFLTDSSQYGTHIGGEQLPSGEKVPIAPGSVISLGATGTTIKIKYRPLLFCLSGFSDGEKAHLTKRLSAIGPRFFGAYFVFFGITNHSLSDRHMCDE